MIIAQQYTAGKTMVSIASPVGTTESRSVLSIVPTGLTWHVVFGPSDKSLGYCRVSLRDKLRQEPKMWVMMSPEYREGDRLKNAE